MSGRVPLYCCVAWGRYWGTGELGNRGSVYGLSVDIFVFPVFPENEMNSLFPGWCWISVGSKGEVPLVLPLWFPVPARGISLCLFGADDAPAVQLWHHTSMPSNARWSGTTNWSGGSSSTPAASRNCHLRPLCPPPGIRVTSMPADANTGSTRAMDALNDLADPGTTRCVPAFPLASNVNVGRAPRTVPRR